MPLLAGLARLVGRAVFKYGKSLLKWAVFASFIAVLVAATVVFWGFYSKIYDKIQSSIDGIGVSYGGLLGCIINSLGIDDFMTSMLAIFVTASIFWGTSVAYIVTFKFGKVAYKSFLASLNE
jgi:hypothetical protein